MDCQNCKCWNKGVPSNWYDEAPAEVREGISRDKYGFCTVLDDITFANSGCEAGATKAIRDNAKPLGD